MMSDKPMTEEKKLEAVMRIFDVGWNCRLSSCYAEWLSKIFREQYWKISVIPFISEIVEEKGKDDCRTVYSCGYWDTFQDRGFKGGHIKKGNHQNLHQVIHCLKEYRRISLEKIDIEQRFSGYQVDVLGEIEPEKYIVVELGELSSYEKLWLIYDPLVKEFWFDGKGKYFYSLKANGELPIEEHLLEHMFDFFMEKCSKDLGQFCNCSTYSREISRLCSFARNSVPERRASLGGARYERCPF
jgi:hypothetical protein